MGRDTFFYLKLVPQDGNLATDTETKQICLQSSLLLCIMKPTKKKKALIEILMMRPYFVEIFHCAVSLVFLA